MRYCDASTKDDFINLVLFITRFSNASPASRRCECSVKHPRLHGIARNLLYAGFHIPLTSFVARLFLPRTVRGNASPSRSLAAKLTLALCRGSAKMTKLRRILRHGSQKCLPSIKCLLYKVSARYFAIS